MTYENWIWVVMVEDSTGHVSAHAAFKDMAVAERRARRVVNAINDVRDLHGEQHMTRTEAAERVRVCAAVLDGYEPTSI